MALAKVDHQLRVIETANHKRSIRSPQHTFNFRAKPWTIQPFFIAPVLPGETMKQLLLQSRAVTDPLYNRLTGWWLEYYFFYVKHRDLNERDLLTQMMLDPSTNISSIQTGALSWTYHYTGSIDWVKLCHDRVVEEYFRFEGESITEGAIDTIPTAQLGIDNWMDSVIEVSTFDAQDVNVDLDADSTITASEVETAMAQWQLMRQQGLTQMSYEDYLRSFGVRQNAVEVHKPELVRYIRDWTYPTNVIEATDGSAASACSWSVTERADKDRFFSEPGFLFGVSVARPKVYYNRQVGAAASMMEDAYTWLPSVLMNDMATSVRTFAGETTPGAEDAEGPIKTAANDYMVDVRDLLMYGDQFRFGVSESTVELPLDNLARRYAAASDVGTLFVNSASNKVHVEHDGIVSLKIASSQLDMSETT